MINANMYMSGTCLTPQESLPGTAFHKYTCTYSSIPEIYMHELHAAKSLGLF